jgi:hypothetical protein
VVKVVFLGNAFIKKMIFESRLKKLIYLNTYNILLVRSVELLVLVTELISFISVVGLVFFEENSELNPVLKLLGLVSAKVVLVPVKVVLVPVKVVLVPVKVVLGPAKVVLVPVKVVLVPVKVVLEFVIVVLELVEAVRIIPL